MERIIYYGTSGCAGHYAMTIKGCCSEQEKDQIARITDSEFVHDFVERNWLHEHCPVLLHTNNYSIYAIPFSVDDNRGACITALITDFDTRLTESDFAIEIEKNEFLKKQFAWQKQ
jgi:hypothetical protein